MVVQEIKQTYDDPEILFGLYAGAGFAGQAMGRPILGTVERVRSFGARSCGII